MQFVRERRSLPASVPGAALSTETALQPAKAASKPLMEARLQGEDLEMVMRKFYKISICLFFFCKLLCFFYFFQIVMFLHFSLFSFVSRNFCYISLSVACPLQEQLFQDVVALFILDEEPVSQAQAQGQAQAQAAAESKAEASAQPSANASALSSTGPSGAASTTAADDDDDLPPLVE